MRCRRYVAGRARRGAGHIKIYERKRWWSPFCAVLMSESKFQLERVQGAPVSHEEILTDIRLPATLAGTNVVSQRLYSEFGKYDPTTAARRFGTWNKAVMSAGLEIANEINIS